MKRPDDVCAVYTATGVRLRTADLGEGIVLIEGDADALQFLGKLLLAQAKYRPDCGFFISPKGPGHRFFERRSRYGFYIHRLPCTEERKVGRSPRKPRSRRVTAPSAVTSRRSS